MRKLAAKYPEDLDAATLMAEALMDLHPWDLWTIDGQPKPWTAEIVEILESILKRNPEHPGANHYYIHAVEASAHPDRAEKAADRLRDLVPVAGHLVHMPAHIYIRIGRYNDGTVANEKAIEADDRYITQCKAQGIYPLAYMPHNHHFMWATLTFEGRSAKAIEAAREIARQQDQDLMRQDGLATLQHYWVSPLYALVRFGRWDEILAEPKPAADLLYPQGIWHYARAMAHIRKKQFAEAEAELADLRKIVADPMMGKITIWEGNTMQSVLLVAVETVAGELAASQGDYGSAVSHLKQGIKYEDALRYDEPADWHAPVRLTLGAVLLEAGEPAEAERVYREDLTKYPRNGWSLQGLAASLAKQGKESEAQDAKRQFSEAWQRADIELTSSRF
jgi:tetratricopeptide (TPR) repeat protein